MNKEFRQDITGLRAVAVLAVTLFHITHVLKPAGLSFSGGFLGVDVFFVISGYLMTKIIMIGLDNGNFSVINFYKRRALRICPALIVVVLISALIGFLILKSHPYNVLIREAVTSLGFISNFRFAKSTDYFDGGDFSHILLHTWSLSVEFQFYLFYPFLLIWLRKFVGTEKISKTVLVITIFLFALSLVWTKLNSIQAYYLLPSRACELFIGALGYFYPISRIKESIVINLQKKMGGGGYKYSPLYEIIGLTIILASFLIIDDSSGWPTIWLVLPMFGTWLCIAANNNISVLRNIVIQKIGVWSYAIYLVHWPIIVYASILGFTDNFIYITLLIFLCGVLLHYSIEKRRNYGRRFTVAYFILAIIISLSPHLQSLLNKYNERYELYESLGGKGFIGNSAVIINGDIPQFIIHGDSHAHELLSSIAYRNIPFVINSNFGCFSVGGYFKDTWEPRNCKFLYSMTQQLSNKYPDVPVVFIQYWTLYGYGDYGHKDQNRDPICLSNNDNSCIIVDKYHDVLFESVVRISKDFMGRKIYIVGSKQIDISHLSENIPNTNILNHSVIKVLSTDANLQFNYQYSETNEILKRAVAHVNELRKTKPELGEIVYIEPYNYCEDNKCNMKLNNNVNIFADYSHYSWAGAEKPVTFILQQIGIDPGIEINDISKVQSKDLNNIQRVLEYSPESGFMFPE